MGICVCREVPLSLTFFFRSSCRRETSFAFILRVMLAVLLLFSLLPTSVLACFMIRSIS